MEGVLKSDRSSSKESGAGYEYQQEVDSKDNEMRFEQVDKTTKTVEHRLDFTGFALNLAVTVFYIGEALPVVGGACRVCKEIVKDLKHAHKRVTDTLNILRRIVDVAMYLQELPKVLKFLPDSKRISDEIACLTDLLSQVRGRISKYSKVGFLSKMIKAGSRLKKLSNLDDQIKTLLTNIKDLFSIIRDENVARKLVELSTLLNRESSFPLETEVESIQSKVEETKLKHDSLNEDEVILKVLGDSEIQDRLVQGGGLASDFIQREIVTSLKFVAENIETLNLKVDRIADQLSNPQNIGDNLFEVKYHVVIAVQPPPSVIVDKNALHHKLGYSFEKQSLIHKVKQMIDVRKGIKVCISATNRGVLSNTISEANCFVYLGTGIGYEEPISTESQENILLSCSLLPRVIIIGLKYGAKQFAERLAKSTMAREVHAIVWVRADIEAQLEVVMNLLPKTIEKFDDQYLKNNLISAAKNLKGHLTLDDSSFGIIRGESFQKNGLFRSCLPFVENDGDVHIEPRCDLSKNNILIPDPAARIWHIDAKTLSVLSCDKGIVFSINRALLNFESRKLIVIRPCSSNDTISINRHRAIAFEVVKKLVVSKDFNGVFRISNLEELSLIVKCINSGNFSKFIHSHHEYDTPGDTYIKGEVLIWADLEEISLLGLSFIQTIVESPEVRVLLNFGSSNVNKKFELLCSKSEDTIQNIKFFNLLKITAETRNAVCSSLHDEIFFDVQVIDGNGTAHFELKSVAIALQSLLGDNYCIQAVYEDDNNCIAVRISLSDVRSLQYLFSLALMNDIGARLLKELKASNAPLCIKYCDAHECEIGYQAYDCIKITANQTNFAKLFEKGMLKLENMTPHQITRLRESKCGNSLRLHIKAPAGSGKTFLALQIIGEQLKKNKGAHILFITKTEALCLHVAKWFHNREVSRDFLEERFHVLFEPMKEGMKKFTILNEKIAFVPDKTIFNSSFVVVIDEAHHLFANTNHVKETSLLHHLVQKKYKSKEIIILSDDSQSSIKMPLNLFNTVDVYLSEVVRHSQRVLAAARQFSTCHFDMTCHHDVAGPALKTFVFSTPPDLMKKELKKLYGKHVSEALSTVKTQFSGLALNGRVGIIVPDKEFLEEYKDEILRALRCGGYFIEFISAREAAATIHDNTTTNDLILFDEIDNVDGQERLIVIAVGFDKFYNPGSFDKVALFYRALSRTQMYFIVVNQHVAGGFLEWMGLLDSSKLLPFSEFNERNRTKRLNPSETTSIFPPKNCTNSIKDDRSNSDAELINDDDDDERSTIAQSIKQVIRRQEVANSFFSSPILKKTTEVVEDLNEPEVIQQSIWDTSSNTFESNLLRPDFLPILNEIEATTSANNHQLLCACNGGDIKDVVRIICSAVNLNCVDERDRTPAYLAASHGLLEILILLKDAGADLTRPCSTAIGSRARHSRPMFQSSIAQHLETPYTIAQANGHSKCAKFIKNSTGGSDEKKQGGSWLLSPINFRNDKNKVKVQNLPEKWASSRMFSPRTFSKKKSSSFSLEEKQTIQNTALCFATNTTISETQRQSLNSTSLDKDLSKQTTSQQKSPTRSQINFINETETLTAQNLQDRDRDDNIQAILPTEEHADEGGGMLSTKEDVQQDASLTSDGSSTALIFDVETLERLENDECTSTKLRDQDGVGRDNLLTDDPMSIGYGMLATNATPTMATVVGLSSEGTIDCKKNQNIEDKDHALRKKIGMSNFHTISKSNVPPDNNAIQSQQKDQNENGFDNLSADVGLEKLSGRVNIINENKETPLHLAVRKGNYAEATELINLGAMINIKNTNGETPLHLAVHTTEKGNVKCIQLLLSRNASVDSQNKNGLTPLHITARSDNKTAAASCLLESNANINAQSKKGDTPLHLAVSYSKINAIKLLLEHGANIHLKNHKLVTPLQAALQKGERHPVRKHFLQHLSDKGVLDKSNIEELLSTTPGTDIDHDGGDKLSV